MEAEEGEAVLFRRSIFQWPYVLRSLGFFSRSSDSKKDILESLQHQRSAQRPTPWRRNVCMDGPGI